MGPKGPLTPFLMIAFKNIAPAALLVTVLTALGWLFNTKRPQLQPIPVVAAR